jgi:hypothetical protein
MLLVLLISSIMADIMAVTMAVLGNSYVTNFYFLTFLVKGRD